MIEKTKVNGKLPFVGKRQCNKLFRQPGFRSQRSQHER